MARVQLTYTNHNIFDSTILPSSYLSDFAPLSRYCTKKKRTYGYDISSLMSEIVPKHEELQFEHALDYHHQLTLTTYKQNQQNIRRHHEHRHLGQTQIFVPLNAAKLQHYALRHAQLCRTVNPEKDQVWNVSPVPQILLHLSPLLLLLSIPVVLEIYALLFEPSAFFVWNVLVQRKKGLLLLAPSLFHQQPWKLKEKIKNKLKKMKLYSNKKKSLNNNILPLQVVVS